MPGKSLDARVLRAVTVLSLAGYGSGISQRVLDPLLSRLAADFDRPLAQVSWVVTGFSLGYALSQLLFGPLGDRYGKLRVITWTCGASSLAALACALAPNLPTLVAARVFAGAMAAAPIPLAMAFIGDAVPYEQRQPVLARFTIGQISGVASAQLLGGLAADYIGHWAPFVLLAVLFALSTVLLLPLRASLGDVERRPAGRTSISSLLQEFSRVFTERWARRVLATVFLEGACVMGAFAFFATHLHQALGLSYTLAGSAATFFGVGGLVYASTARHLLPRMGEAGFILTGTLLLATMMVLVALAPPAAAAAAACLGTGLGFYTLHSTLQTHATQMAPERRGAAVAAFALCYFLGQAVGVSLAGWGSTHFGTRTMIIAAALGVAGIGLQYARARDRSLAVDRR